MRPSHRAEQPQFSGGVGTLLVGRNSCLKHLKNLLRVCYSIPPYLKHDSLTSTPKPKKPKPTTTRRTIHDGPIREVIPPPQGTPDDGVGVTTESV